MTDNLYYIHIYTECNRRNVRDFGRVFLRSNSTDITQNTYIQSTMVTEILAGEKCGLPSLVSAYCTLSVTSYSSYPLDHNGMDPLYFSCIPKLSLDAAQRPWLRIRCSQCIVVGSQWTTMTRVRVFL